MVSSVPWKSKPAIDDSSLFASTFFSTDFTDCALFSAAIRAATLVGRGGDDADGADCAVAVAGGLGFGGGGGGATSVSFSFFWDDDDDGGGGGFLGGGGGGGGGGCGFMASCFEESGL